MALPFSIVEFGNLVALALETDGPDRFSESFLQFDPELGSDIKPSARGFIEPRNMTSGWCDSTTPSRPRRLFEKLKHKASALVLRAPAPPKAARAIFSRPASLVTAPPPSPTKSARSFSTTSSASPATPTTDDFARPSTSPNTSRWSLSTDESTTSCHPFASHHDDDDPFAKGRVQVIRNSADYPSYTYAFAKRRSQPRTPDPIRVQPPPDWTLALPTTPPRSLARARSYDDEDSSDSSHPRSLCPSAWHPSTPPAPRTYRRKSRAPLPPRTADSIASSSAPTLRDRERERARALAALNGELHPRALEAFAPQPDDEQAYYSARSSLAGSPQSHCRRGLQRPRVRVDSQVRPLD